MKGKDNSKEYSRAQEGTQGGNKCGKDLSSLRLRLRKATLEKVWRGPLDCREFCNPVAQTRTCP